MTLKPGVVIADDHFAMLAKVANLLERRFEILAAVENGSLALEAIANLRPAVAVLDIAMPEMSGIEVGKQIRRIGIPTKIVFLTIQSDPEYVEVAADLAAGFVLKPRMQTDLLIAMEETLAGRPFVSPSIVAETTG